MSRQRCTPLNEQEIQAAGLAILTEEQPAHFLLLKHKDRWDLPKGHLEKGEDIIVAALRETQEETGIPADDLQLDHAFRFELRYAVQSSKRGQYQKLTTYFLAYLPARRPIVLTEHIAYQWFPLLPAEPIQAQTIDPLMKAVRDHIEAR